MCEDDGGGLTGKREKGKWKCGKVSYGNKSHFIIQFIFSSSRWLFIIKFHLLPPLHSKVSSPPQKKEDSNHRKMNSTVSMCFRFSTVHYSENFHLLHESLQPRTLLKTLNLLHCWWSADLWKSHSTCVGGRSKKRREKECGSTRAKVKRCEKSDLESFWNFFSTFHIFLSVACLLCFFSY